MTWASAYTYPVLKGCSLEDFVWKCAGAMSPLYCSSLEERLRQADGPDPASKKHLDECERCLQYLERLSDEQWEMKARESFANAKAAIEIAQKENDLERQRLKDMLEMVQMLELPESHDEFKRFMVNQLRESMVDYSTQEAVLVPTEEYKAMSLRSAREAVERAKDDLRKCTEANAKKAEWLRVLMSRVPPPVEPVMGEQR